jgi:cytochrome c
MESMEFTKVCSAVLTAGIAFVALGIVSDDLSHPHRLKESVLKIKGAETTSAPVAAAPPALPPIAPLLAKADPAAGEAFTHKICIACHNFNPGGANKVGPLLYGVVGREKASYAGYTYSSALKSKGGKWTFADLNEWLHKPSAYAPGTKMAYAGIDNDQMRANVIDYLRTLSPNPEPLPPVTAADTAPPAQAASAAPAGPAQPPLDTLLAAADPARGKAYTRKICIACHNFAEGAGNKVGPDLYGVVGRDKASYPGFTYSSALKAKGGKWTFADLNTWLTKPSAYAPGTKMAYAGQENPQLRADVIDYLRTLSPNPEPLPGGATPASSQAPAASAPAPAKPAVVSPAPVTNKPAPGAPAPQNGTPNGASLTTPPPKP